jgi:deferrochelatase/peroxidase EfeB
VTPPQSHTYLAAFDLTTAKRADVKTLLRRWTDAAAALSEGRPVEIPGDADYETQADSSEVLGLPPSYLTITFGFGLGLFEKDGVDRYGLRSGRPAAFVDLPHFPGEQLVPARTGGDLLVQACADNPQVAFHAARQLARLAYGIADIRWFPTSAPAGPAQFDGFQGRHQQSRDRRPEGNGCRRLGRRRSAGLDARRLLYGRAARAHGAS